MLIQRFLQLRDAIDSLLERLEGRITKSEGETRKQLAELESELRTQHDEIAVQIAELEQQGEMLNEEVQEEADGALDRIQHSIEEVIQALKQSYQPKGGE